MGRERKFLQTVLVMTKVDTMPIYGKNLNKADDLETCGIECSVTTKFLRMMTLGGP